MQKDSSHSSIFEKKVHSSKLGTMGQSGGRRMSIGCCSEDTDTVRCPRVELLYVHFGSKNRFLLAIFLIFPMPEFLAEIILPNGVKIWTHDT